VSQGSLSDIESGKSKPSIDTVVSIYLAFDCSFEWLLLNEKIRLSERASNIKAELLSVMNELDSHDQAEILEIALIKKNKR
jgi:transcriptional regulator with XRE-family HTH domain